MKRLLYHFTVTEKKSRCSQPKSLMAVLLSGGRIIDIPTRVWHDFTKNTGSKIPQESDVERPSPTVNSTKLTTTQKKTRLAVSLTNIRMHTHVLPLELNSEGDEQAQPRPTRRVNQPLQPSHEQIESNDLRDFLSKVTKGKTADAKGKFVGRPSSHMQKYSDSCIADQRL
eukprot:2983596-Pleurochrysis_carterae.AAC.1